MGQLATAVINQAGNELGVREATGHNDGPAVEMFLKAVGLPKGYSWCMAFVYWCVQQSCAVLGFKNPLKQTGGVLDQYTACKAIRVCVPQPGDIFIMDFGSGEGHTGIVTGVFADKRTIHTIEGNTNDNGSREGVGVFRKERSMDDKKIIGYLRLPEVKI